jgi:hypothetical protein
MRSSSLHDLDTDFDGSLVPRMPGSRRHHRLLVVLGQFIVRSLCFRIVAARARDAALQLIADQLSVTRSELRRRNLV